ncbi:Plasmodium vivax Vir protein, putative [Plasmodium ovale]|uniref:Plasmodium vivax Vir protein, putative n=1 Tax=Plasmodium ovale TaxID=36330 RepID=A0A1C3KK86_PLAOA|nr:Plasmodium vivax Vir protein, putative [Plasmodium ovale]
MEEAEKILIDSSKYILYNKLNQNCDDVSKYVNYCRRVNYLKRYYSDILDVCYKFARNLINLNEILIEETNDERCRYVNFWITDNIRRKLETEWHNKDHINSILTGFYSVQYAITTASPSNNCYFDYRSSIDLYLWKERKDLHDYIRNYEYIKKKITLGGDICTTYYKYFDYIKGLHEKYKGECCDYSSEKCHNRINLDYFCTSDSYFEKLPCDGAKGVVADSSEAERDRVLGGQPEGARFRATPYSSLDTDSDAEGDLLNHNANDYAKLGFTTFGNWIRSKVLKNKININLDEDAQNFIPHELNNVGENINTDDYSITYHPS